jgi:hypothetical protein
MHTKFWSENLGRLGQRWEDNIRMDLKEIVWDGVDCIHLAQDGNNRNEISGSVKGTEFFVQLPYVFS